MNEFKPTTSVPIIDEPIISHLTPVDESFQVADPKDPEGLLATQKKTFDILDASMQKKANSQFEEATAELRKLHRNNSPETRSRKKDLLKEIATLKEKWNFTVIEEDRQPSVDRGRYLNEQGLVGLSQNIDQVTKVDVLQIGTLDDAEIPKILTYAEMEIAKQLPGEEKILTYAEFIEKDKDDIAKRLRTESEVETPKDIDKKTFKPKSPEELIALQEKVLKMLGGAEKKVEARAEKAGLEAMIAVRKVGEMWNKVPKRYKYMLAGGMMLSGAGAVLAGSAFALGATGLAAGGVRFASGAALFVTFEKMFQISHDKKNKEPRSKAMEARHAVYSGALAIAIGALMPKIFQGFIGEESVPLTPAGVIGTESLPLTPEGLPLEFPSILSAPENPLLTPDGLPFDPIEATVAENIPPSPESIPKIEFVVPEGGNLWNGIEAILEKQGLLEGMERGQREHFIDALKDKFADMSKNSPEKLEAMGFPDGKNIHLVRPGNIIDLTKVLGDTQLLPDVIHDAEMLSANQIASIEGYSDTQHIAPEVSPMVEDYSVSAPTEPTIIEQSVAAPQQVLPSDPQILAYADHAVNEQMSERFGSKGFFGLFGGTPWEKSIDIIDKDVGLAGKSVVEIMDTTLPSAFPEDGVRRFGFESRDVREKAIALIHAQVAKTGVTPGTGEKFLDYFKRSASINIASTLNKN